MAAVVLGQIDLNNKIVTADALRTVKATANHIHDHGGEFVLPVKENRRALFDALDALPWGQAPIAHTATDKGHGRITTRTIQVLRAPESLHWIRDTLYQEDKSKVRTRSGPRVMAALLAIGALRLAGRVDVTEATRWAGRSMDRPFTILRLTS